MDNVNDYEKCIRNSSINHSRLIIKASFQFQLICSMISPEYFGSSVSPRFLRHFNKIRVDEFDDETLRSIFSKIVLWHLDAR